MPQDTDVTAAGLIDLAREQSFSIGPLTVRPSVCEVVLGAKTISLQPRVLQVLVVLAKAGGKVVSREELLASCWNGVVVGDDAVGRCIGRLRRLSEVEAPGAFTIVTQPRVGYRLVDARSKENQAAAPKSAIEAAAETVDDRVKPGRRIPAPGLVLAGVATALIVGLIAAFVVATHPARSPFLTAVSTFRVQGADADLGETLADRVAAAVNDRQLPIVARVRSGRGDFGAARYIVGGDIRRVGESLRVEVKIDDARSGLALWSATVVRALPESEALQDQVAGKIADLIDLVRRFRGPEGDTATPEAMAALFKASEAMRGGGATRLETREAFRRFSDLAPTSSRAHSAFAMATARSLSTQPLAVAEAWRAQALGEARRAIALDRNNGEGYTALGILTPPDDLVQREAWFARGLSFDPNNSSLCNFYGNLLLTVGRTKEGLLWMERSRTLDPLSGPKTYGVIYALSAAGRFGDAQPLISRAQRLWPADPGAQQVILSTSLIYAPPAQALATLEKFQATGDPMPADHAAAWRAFEMARAGALSPQTAMRGLAGAVATTKNDEIDTEIAALALFGDTDDAFRAIELGRAQHRFSPYTL